MIRPPEASVSLNPGVIIRIFESPDTIDRVTNYNTGSPNGGAPVRSALPQSSGDNARRSHGGNGTFTPPDCVCAPFGLSEQSEARRPQGKANDGITE